MLGYEKYNGRSQCRRVKKIDELFISEDYLEKQIEKVLNRIAESEERVSNNSKLMESFIKGYVSDDLAQLLKEINAMKKQLSSIEKELSDIKKKMKLK